MNKQKLIELALKVKNAHELSKSHCNVEIGDLDELLELILEMDNKNE